jgi:biotin transport system substrate-specific component
MLVASLVIVALGASVLALVVGLSAAQALALGVVPFLAGDAAKIVAATLLIPSLTRRA